MGLSEVVSVLRQKQSFLIAGHVNPEGDALGSALALALALRAMGKQAEVVNKDPFPQQLLFLPHQDLFFRREKILQPAEVLVVVDCGSFDRIGYPLPLPIPLIVNIDHHITNPAFGHVNWLVPTATATGEMIYDLLREMELPITPAIATCLYAALVTETGSFRYVNTTAKSLRVAADLIEKGADPAGIAQAVFETSTVERVSLLGEVLMAMEILPDERIAWICVTQAQLQKTGTTLEDTEDFVTYPRSIKNVEVAVFFREVGHERYKISFRSQGRINAAFLAQKWGGGGHSYAAGCSFSGSWERVKEVILSSVQEVIREGSKQPSAVPTLEGVESCKTVS